MAGRTLIWNGEAFLKAVTTKTERRLAAVTKVLADEMIRQIDEPKSGRLYKVRKGSSEKYTASAPGETPASPTGKLIRSIVHEVIRQGNDLFGRVGVNASMKFIAVNLARGIRDIKPRPMFKNTLARGRQAAAQAFRRGT